MILALAALAVGTAFAQKAEPKGAAPAAAAPPPTTADCLGCHGTEGTGAPMVKESDLNASPHKDLGCTGCHSSVTSVPHTEAMVKDKPACANCHPTEDQKHALSVHARPDKVAGDHPVCITCHGGGNPHGIKTMKSWTKQAKATVCIHCHGDRARMARYGVDPDAEESYNESFHGKALLRYGLTKAAMCADCHSNHEVRQPSDPASTTNPANVATTCGKSGCHQGAKLNFATSGANHLKLKTKEATGLFLEELFFKVLTIGTLVFLLVGVMLDLRTKVFNPRVTHGTSQLVSVIISLSFVLLVSALAMMFLGAGQPKYAVLAALIIMAIALMVHFATPHPKPDPKEPMFQRFTVAQRLQHLCLVISFVILVLTGLPLRYAGDPWLNMLYAILGGINEARIIHRVAATVMIVTWVWHTLYLIYRWQKAGFKLSSWSMWPSKHDLTDLIVTVKHYVGHSPEVARHDRFSFKEKFDYFAVYWGMPIMVFSGLVLWFPIALGNRLPELSISVAYIAHSDEAILAFLAILTWHFYNTHFNPDNFPMAKTWINGQRSLSQMEHEHPLELERILAAQSGAAEAGAGGDKETKE